MNDDESNNFIGGEKGLSSVREIAALNTDTETNIDEF
jgi:hypothetical protein